MNISSLSSKTTELAKNIDGLLAVLGSLGVNVSRLENKPTLYAIRLSKSRAWRMNQTAEQREARNARQRERYANLTEEQREVHRAQVRACYRKKLAAMTDPEREAFLTRYCEAAMCYYWSLTSEQYQALLAKRRARRARMTAAEWAAFHAKKNCNERIRYANMPEEKKAVLLAKQRERDRKRYASLTGEKKKAYLAQKSKIKKKSYVNRSAEKKAEQRAKRQAWRESLPAERKEAMRVCQREYQRKYRAKKKAEQRAKRQAWRTSGAAGEADILAGHVG